MRTETASQNNVSTNLQAEHAVAVTKSDVTVFTDSTLYVGTGGDVAVTTSAGETCTIPSVPSGSILPVLVTQVLSTGTTASGIVRFS